MSIIYSYPEQGALNANDMLIGTSAEKVGGKQKNITRNFTVQQIADFINRGAGFVDPVASDFQIPVFNQGGTKITGSIISQNTSPSNGSVGSAITITGSLTVTNGATIGDFINDITLQSPTALIGPIKDANNALSTGNQILLSTPSGNVIWQNYEAGLTYEGTWNASTNTPTLVSATGVSGHFYIVSVAGNTNLDGNNDWHVGDWAVFFDAGGGGAGAWQKIDNTSVITGNGTANTFAMWTATETLNDSILTQDAGATKIQVAGGIDTTGIIQPSTTNANLQIQGNGTGGVEVRGAGGNDGKIQLNCSNNNHGVTLQSPPHASGATYTLVLPTSTGTAGQILTTAGGSSSQLTWSTIVDTNTTYDLGSSTDGSNVRLNLDASAGADSFVTLVGSGVGIAQVNDTITFTVPAGDTYDLGSGTSGVANSVELQLTSGSGTDNSAITLTGGTGITVAQAGDVVTLTGAAQGVTSVTGDSTTIAATAGNTPVISAITTGGVGPTSTSLATGAQIQTAIDTALSGAVTFKGTFDASTGTIASGGSLYTCPAGGPGGTVDIAIGDLYIVTTAGSFYCSGTSLNVGDEVICITAATAGNSSVNDWNAVASGSGGAVTGSGTTSYVPKFTGSTVVGDSNIFDDLGSIGIGTISPVSALHVSTTVNEVLTLQSITSSQKIKFNDTNNPGDDSDFGSVSGNLAMFTNNFGTPNTQTFTFNKDGKLGINQTLPSYSLDIQDSNFDPAIRLFAPSSSSEILIQASQSSSNNNLINSNTNDLDFQGNGSSIMTLGVSNNSGSVTLGQYGQGNKTGTATYNLAVDSVGKVIEVAGGGGLPTKTVDTFTGSGQSFIDLTVEASSVNYIDMYIDGVYQAKATYTIATPGGTTISRLTLVSGTFPTGVSIETVTTT